jgi:AraC-like DNA-binding protein
MASDRYAIGPWARVLIADLGLRERDVLRLAGLPDDLLARGSSWLRPADAHALWAALDELVADPRLPLTMAEHVGAESLSPPVMAALCSPNLEVAAERIALHKRLVGPMRLRVDRVAGDLMIAIEWPPPTPAPPPVLVAFELAFWVRLARLGTRVDITPRRLTAPTPPPDSRPWRDAFGLAIEPGPVAAVTFRQLDASRPFLTADDAMWEFFAPELRRRLADLDATATTSDRVRAALVELLPSGRGSMGDVARHLTVSTRTLQRRLHAEDTTFQDVLDDTRERLARHYLTDPTLTSTDIAYLLGYAEPTSFSRAFSAWTGRTPHQIRQESA